MQVATCMCKLPLARQFTCKNHIFDKHINYLKTSAAYLLGFASYCYVKNILMHLLCNATSDWIIS